MNFQELQNNYDNSFNRHLENYIDDEINFESLESETRSEIETFIKYGITDKLVSENGDIELFSNNDNLVIDSEFSYLVSELV